jgi:hypothetical protein
MALRYELQFNFKNTAVWKFLDERLKDMKTYFDSSLAGSLRTGVVSHVAYLPVYSIIICNIRR